MQRNSKSGLAVAISIVSLIISLANLLWGDGVISSIVERKQLEERRQLLLAKEYALTGEYERVAEILSSDVLENNKYSFLNRGVMYAEGLYFLYDIEQATSYFYKALEAGEQFYSIKYLLSILDENNDDERQEMNRLFLIGCENKNSYCEKVLFYAYNNAGYIAEDTYIDDFLSRSLQERQNIMDCLYQLVGSYVQYEVSGYEYYIDNGQLSAEAIVNEVERNVLSAVYFSTDYEMIFDIS